MMITNISVLNRKQYSCHSKNNIIPNETRLENVDNLFLLSFEHSKLVKFNIFVGQKITFYKL